MESTHTAAFNIPELNKAASIAHVFPGMANHSLLSVGKLLTRDTQSLSGMNRSQFAILRSFKF
jgi:hypothetical protein